MNKLLQERVERDREKLETWARYHQFVLPGSSLKIEFVITGKTSLTEPEKLEPTKNDYEKMPLREYFSEQRFIDVGVGDGTLTRVLNVVSVVEEKCPTVGDLLAIGEEGLRRYRRCGRTTISHIRRVLGQNGITLRPFPGR